MTARPWHKRWHGNALNGTRSLSLELRGAYQTLQDLMYDAGGPIRLEERRICGEFDCDIRVFKRVMSDLIAADKIRLWSDGSQVWIINDRVLKELKIEGYEPETCAELTPEVRDKFGIANAQLSPKSYGKRNKNSGAVERTDENPDDRGRGKKKEPPVVPQGDADQLTLVPDDTPPDEPKAAFDAWNRLAAEVGLPAAKDLTDGRRKAIGKRLDQAGMAGWTEALAAVRASKFCRGLAPPRPDRAPFRADLDFVCQAKNFQRLREGFYGQDAPAPAAVVPIAATWKGPPEIRAAVVAAKDEGFAVSWLDRCTWRDIPDRCVVSANSFVVDTLRREVGGPLSNLGVRVRLESAA